MNMLAIFYMNYFDWTMKKFRDSFTLVDAVRGNLLISLTKPWSHPGRAGHYKHTTINRDLFSLFNTVCECHLMEDLMTEKKCFRPTLQGRGKSCRGIAEVIMRLQQSIRIYFIFEGVFMLRAQCNVFVSVISFII